MDKVYHGSSKRGLDIIKPNISSHGKSYIYASKNKIVASLFMEKWNDYIFSVGDDEYGNICIVENYEGAFEDVYKGRKGSIYTLDSKDFRKVAGLWANEVVSEKNQRIIHEEKIENIYDELIALSEQGLLGIYKYPDKPRSFENRESFLINLLIKNIQKTNNIDAEIGYFLKLHPRLTERVMDLFR